MKITKERLFPELRESPVAASQQGITEVVPKPNYTSTLESSAFAMAAGGGLDVRLHPALALRLANLEYRRNWNPTMSGQSFNDGLSLSIAMVLRMGTW
jgi:hypothetical protein